MIAEPEVDWVARLPRTVSVDPDASPAPLTRTMSVAVLPAASKSMVAL